MEADAVIKRYSLRRTVVVRVVPVIVVAFAVVMAIVVVVVHGLTPLISRILSPMVLVMLSYRHRG
jgi:thiol:disulfide interchange protein